MKGYKDQVAWHLHSQLALRPSVVPLAIASSKLLPILSEETLTSVLMSSVCGYRILEITIAPGAAITEAANKCFAKTQS